MEKNLKIEDYERKEAKTGRMYYRFKTSDGWMSCFEDSVVQELMKYKGGMVTVSIAERENGFKNILGIVENGGVPNNIPVKQVSSGNTMSMPKDSDTKLASVLTSYVKDILVARGGYEEMDLVWMRKFVLDTYKGFLTDL